jgi:hypothetical protein
MRARVAFMIACMENSVQHLELTHPRWQILIGGLWDRLGDFFYPNLELFVCDRTPSCVEIFENYSEYLQDLGQDEDQFELTEQEFIDLKEIYIGSTIPAKIVELMKDISRSGIYTEHVPLMDYETLDDCIILLETHGIPLPPFENFVSFVWTEGTSHSGIYTRADFFPDPNVTTRSDFFPNPNATLFQKVFKFFRSGFNS